MNALDLPEGRIGQAVAAILAIAAVCLVWLGIVQPLVTLFVDREAALADQAARADHLASMIARLPALRAQLSAHTVNGPAADAMLDGTTDGIAEANLQRIVEQLAATSGAALSSFEAAPVQTIGRARRIGVSVGATCRYDSLVQLLVAIEQSSPKMLVGDLQIHNIDTGGVDKSHPIETSFTVYAFRQVQPAEAGDGS